MANPAVGSLANKYNIAGRKGDTQGGGAVVDPTKEKVYLI
jgi:hypothetical protein